MSYEGSLFGINVDCNSASEEIIRSELSFGFHETPGSLKALAISSAGRYLICGGMDEYIRVFDLEKKCSLGEMSGHTGCVTALGFVGEKFVISGSEDGTMIIWKVHGWQKLHILGGHKGPVNDFALHPSGKLCVSVSKDNTLKIWNLVHGRCAFTRRLKGPAQNIAWHQEKDYYLLIIGNEVQIYNSSGNNECTGKVTLSSRVNKACFVDIGAAESAPGVQQGEIYVAIISDDCNLQFVTEMGVQMGAQHDLSRSLGGSRPRDLSCCSLGDLSGLEDERMKECMDGEGDAVVVVSSSGAISVFSVRRLCEGDEGGEEEDDDEEERGNAEKDLLAHARLASFSIPSEPRITAVAAYCLVGRKHTDRSSKGEHKDLELVTEGDVAEEASEDGGTEEKKSKKQKKKRKSSENSPREDTSVKKDKPRKNKTK